MEYLDGKTMNLVMAGFDGKKVLVIGDVMLDEYVYGDCNRISPEAPVPIVLQKMTKKKLGGAGNVALNLRGLGAEVDLCAITQNDPAGFWISQELAKMGIGDKTLGSHNKRQPIVVSGPTIRKTRICVGNQQVCRLDSEPCLPLDSLERLLLDFSQYEAIFISDYNKGFITDRLMAQVRESGVPFYCDPKSTDLRRYAGSEGITPNKEEALAFLFPFPSEDLIYNLNKLDIKSCMITCGDNGVQFWDRMGPGFPKIVGAYPVTELADACGAGDTAFAVFGLSKLCGASTEVAASIANLAGALVCRHFGVVPITKLALVNEGTNL